MLNDTLVYTLHSLSLLSFYWLHKWNFSSVDFGLFSDNLNLKCSTTYRNHSRKGPLTIPTFILPWFNSLFTFYSLIFIIHIWYDTHAPLLWTIIDPMGSNSFYVYLYKFYPLLIHTNTRLLFFRYLFLTNFCDLCFSFGGLLYPHPHYIGFRVHLPGLDLCPPKTSLSSFFPPHTDSHKDPTLPSLTPSRRDCSIWRKTLNLSL